MDASVRNFFTPGRLMRLLVVEDDSETAAYLVKGLREAGHTVDHAANGRDGLFLATGEKYDAFILDRLLPQLDGLTLISTVRASGNTTPAIILSALGEVDERVRGLRAGGDDYLVKPFAFAELNARLDAVTRRGAAKPAETVLRVADLELDRLSRSARRGRRAIELKPQEFRLLEYLMRHSGQVITRTMLFEGVWDYHFDPQTNVIDVHISRLRSKVDGDDDPPLIHTVRGAGYCLRGPIAPG
jgi:two-component system OmpR family response regulator